MYKRQNGHRLYTDVNGRVALPAADPITETVIGICHMGDLRHRSIADTLTEFRRYYYIFDMKKTAEYHHVRSACGRCLACIKTRTQQVIPRPLWYMVYATAPFEYLHLDFLELPDATNGMKHVLVIVDDFSLTTVSYTHLTLPTICSV